MMVLPPATSGTVRGQSPASAGQRGDTGSFQKTMQQLEQDVYQSGGKSVAFDGRASGRQAPLIAPDGPEVVRESLSPGTPRAPVAPSTATPLVLFPVGASAAASPQAYARDTMHADRGMAMPLSRAAPPDPASSQEQEVREIERHTPSTGVATRDRKPSADAPVVTVFLGDDIPAISVQLKGPLGSRDKHLLMRMLQEAFAQHGLEPGYAYLNGERLAFPPSLPASR